MKSGKMDNYWSRIGGLWAKQNIVRENKEGRKTRRMIVAKRLADLLVSVKQPIDVLEIGCNYGQNLHYLHHAFKENGAQATLHGIDLSSEALDVARQHTHSAVFTQASWFDLPFAASSFDLVFTMGVFMHIHFDNVDKAASIVEVLLKPGGYVCHTEAASDAYIGRTNIRSNPAYGPRQQYIFQHDYNAIYSKNTRLEFVERFELPEGLTVLIWRKND